MGADMMIAKARAPRFTAAAQRELTRVLADARRAGVPNTYGTVMGQVAADRMAGNEIDPDDFSWHDEYVYDDPDHVYPQAQLQRWAATAVRQVFTNHREVAQSDFDGTEWLITGGLSWGDAPTEVFNAVEILDAYRIFDRQVTVVELLDAIRKLEGPQPVIEA